MIIEKRGSFLEASDEEKSERVLVLTCGIDGIGRSPDFYNFIKKYPPKTSPIISIIGTLIQI